MNYYLETDTSQVYAYDDQQVEEGWVKEGLAPITEGEAIAIANPPVSLTREQVEALRLNAYANPVTGSDRYFAEAARMNAMGEAGADAVTAAGVARYEEIQSEYPWP